MSPLINLIYTSSAVNPMTETELIDLLSKSVENNKRLDVTGMLLYRGGSFLQVLEGDNLVVKNLYKVIDKDARHYRILRLHERRIAKREFENWSMGFVNLDTIDVARIPGYSPYLNEHFTSNRFKQAGFAHVFLRMFKEHIQFA